MGLFGSRRQRVEPDESKLLAADLYAGGVRADRAIAFLAEQMSEKFRSGGDHAVELFSDWMDILMDGNQDTARKFCATVLPMLPAETRRKALAQHGVESDSNYGEPDPLLESLATKVVIGGRDGATAITSIFNAIEKVKGICEAKTVIERLFAGLSPDIRRSMMAHLPERLRNLID